MSTEAQQNTSTVEERHNPFAKKHEPVPDPRASTTEEIQQPGQDQIVQQADPPVFYKIIDVITEYQRGNYLPVLHCLKYNLIAKDYVDYTGYNVLHHAVSQGAIPIILILLDHFKIDVNIRSGSQQTSLMIACHYGHIEILKILCERGAQINCQDNTKFTALLYCIKQGFIPHAAYLLQQEADLKISDLNGCTVVHWAAFRNNVFMLKVFKRLGLELNGTDLTGMTPLDRAVQGGCHESVEFLLKHCDDKLPANLKFGELPESDIKGLLRKKFFPSPNDIRKEKAQKFFEKHSRTITFSFYAIFCFLSINMYVNVLMYKGFGYTGDLIYLLFNLYFIAYTFWYFMKSSKSSSSNKVFSYQQVPNAAEESFASAAPTYKLRYNTLDKLLKGDTTDSIIEDVDTSVFPSFFHELAWHWDQKNYRQIAKFSERDYCPTCLQRQPPRSIHPEGSAFCITQYHHFSPCLNRPVDGNNHFLYLGLLMQQMILLSMFVLGTWLTLEPEVQNKKIWFLEAGYLLATNYNIIHAIVYLLACVFSGYNFYFLSIELYGLVKNVTYSEIFESFKHPDLFKIKLNPRGGYGFAFFNPYNKGIIENVKEYFMRIIQANGI